MSISVLMRRTNERYAFIFVMPMYYQRVDLIEFIIALWSTDAWTSVARTRQLSPVESRDSLKVTKLILHQVATVATAADDLGVSNAERTPTVLCIVLPSEQTLILLTHALERYYTSSHDLRTREFKVPLYYDYGYLTQRLSELRGDREIFRLSRRNPPKFVISYLSYNLWF